MRINLPLETNQPTDITRPMVEAALKAAHIALKRRKEGLAFTNKPDTTWVTNGDYQAEQLIRDVLSKASGDIAKKIGVDKIGFITEENLEGDQKSQLESRSKGAHWVIDPIDGTIGYSQASRLASGATQDTSLKPWAISIALEKDGKTIASVVYEASEKEYANSTDQINPNVPNGTLYWTDKFNEEGVVHQLSKGLSISETSTDLYDQTVPDSPKGHVDEKVLLAKPEALSNALLPHYSRVKHQLVKTTNIATNAPILLDANLETCATRRAAANPELKIVNPKPLLEKFATEHQKEFKTNYSSVAGALAAMTGRSAMSINHGQPWDNSAVRLMLEQSGTPFREYHIPSDGKADTSNVTLLIAGHNQVIFGDSLKTLIDTGAVTDKVTTGEDSIWEQITTALGAIVKLPDIMRQTPQRGRG